MKIVKIFFMLAIVSMVVVSCKETKKEEVQDDAAVEMTEESSNEAVTDAAADDQVPSDAQESEGDGAAAAAGSMEPAKGINAASKDLEELTVPEGVLAEELADTPVIYPGCSGSAAEMRACNKESFIAFIKGEFDKSLAPKLNLDEGDYEIRSIIHVDEAGKISTMKISAPDKAMEDEMVRVISKAPMVVPATKGGKPVAISFLLPVKFKVKI